MNKVGLLLVFSFLGCLSPPAPFFPGILEAGSVLVRIPQEEVVGKKISLVGDFSLWSEVEMTFNEESGFWEGALELKPGVYQWKLLLDNRYLSPEFFPGLEPAFTELEGDGTGSTVGIWVVQ